MIGARCSRWAGCCVPMLGARVVGTEPGPHRNLRFFLVNRPKPRSRAMNPQKHNPAVLRCPRSSTAKSCCGTIPAPSAAPVARAPGIPDQQRLRCLRRRHDALSLMISRRGARSPGEGELDSVGLGSVPDAFAERYETVRAGLVGVLGWQCLATALRLAASCCAAFSPTLALRCPASSSAVPDCRA
jgi:hypothetical protein